MFAAATIVFRETLEAALIVGIVAAATRTLPGRGLWIGVGIALGVFGALVLASCASELGQLANGMGHEIFSACAVAIALVMLSIHNVWMASHGRQMAADARALGARARSGDLAMSAVAVVIALTVLREGAETVLFFLGVLAGDGAGRAQTAQGAILGVSLGAGVGVLIYHGLSRIPVAHFFTVTSWLLLLVLAGMAAQLAQLLIQADLISPIVQPLWDSSGWVSPDSGLGTVLRALVGYDPQPSATEIAFEILVIVIVVAATRIARRTQAAA